MFLKLGLISLLSLANLRHGGTFIAAVICEDGIVVASDSRTTFIDTNDTPFAYVDGMPKLFVDRGAAVALSGMSNLESELFSSFVRRNEYLLERPVDEILFGFLVWLPFVNSENVGLVSAGYIDGKPTICGKAPITPQECTSSGYISNKESTILRNLRRSPRTTEAAAALKAAIQERARTDVTVGGPVTILKLTNGSEPVWLENPPTDRGWTKICDVVNAHRRGEVKIVAREAQDEVDNRLKNTCP